MDTGERLHMTNKTDVSNAPGTDQDEFRPVHVSSWFVIGVSFLHLSFFVSIGIVIGQRTMLPWYLFPVATYVCEVLGWTTHWLGHKKWTGAWYEAHMGHHMHDYPPWRFLSAKYIPAQVDHGPRYMPAITATPLLASLICGMPFTLEVWLCGISASILVMYVSNELHHAYHVRHHPAERWSWFHKLRALHFLHHKGNMQHNYGISDYLLDGVNRSMVCTTDEARRRVVVAAH